MYFRSSSNEKVKMIMNQVEHFQIETIHTMQTALSYDEFIGALNSSCSCFKMMSKFRHTKLVCTPIFESDFVRECV